MNSLSAYMIQVILISGLMYLFYYLVLKNLTYFRLNRYYLLSAFVLSVVIPLIHIPVKSSVSEIVPYVMLNEIVVGSSGQQSFSVAGTAPDIFRTLYLFVSVLLGFRIIFGFYSIIRIYRKSEKMDFGSLKVYSSEVKISPFSIFNMIFINNEEASDNKSVMQIIAHENTHISQFHSLDIIVSEILCVVFWINPFFWLIKYNLKSTHEYLADEKVMEQGFEPAGYFMLLFSNVVGIRIGLANNLNQSLTLKRMKMMKKERSPRYLRMAYLLTLPFVAAIVFAFSCTDAGAGFKPIEKKGNVMSVADDTIKTNVTGEVYEEVDEMPVYGKGQQDLVDYIVGEVKYPDDARKKGIQGKVFVSFVVTPKGDVKDVSVVEPVNDLLDAEAIRVVSSMKKWNPGKLNGKAVSVKMVMPIMFKLDDKK